MAGDTTGEPTGGKPFFEGLQDSYYGICDFLENKGIKVYEWFVDPLEDRGIPSFPLVSIILLFILLAALSLVFNPFADTGVTSSLSVAVSNELGGVTGARVGIYAADGSMVSELKTREGIALFDGLKPGKYELRIFKDGFDNATQTVLVPEQKYVEIKLKSIGLPFNGDQQPSGLKTKTSKTPSDLDFSSSKSLTLSIFVKDTDGNPVDGTAIVYDAVAGSKLDTIDIKDGFGSIQDLKAGMSVYADIAADGFVSYYGKTTGRVAISARSPNVLNVVLTKLTADQLNEFKPTFLTITQLDDMPVDKASIQVFVEGSKTAIPLSNYQTNATGNLVVLLNSTGDPNYKVLASKTGFEMTESHVFKAGDSITVKIRHPGEYSDEEKQASTNLTVIVTKDGDPVQNAIVTISGDTLATRTLNTNAQGVANAFLLNQKGNTVDLSASKGILVAFDSIQLTDMVMSRELQMQRQNASVITKAIDYFNNASVSSVNFTAYADGGLVLGACSAINGSEGCELKLPIGLSFKIGAIAANYVPENDTIPINGQQVSVLFRLIRSDLLTNSLIKDFKVVNPDSGEEALVMYPGKTYLASFKLLAATNSTSDAVGFYFGVDSTKAVIDRVEPPAPFMKGSSTPSCSPKDLDWRKANAAWVDFEYAGSTRNFSKTVTVNFSIKPLDKIKEIPFGVRYRSYLLKDGKYYRNPFDQNLGFDPDSGALKSGCNATVTTQTLLIDGIGTSCSDFACTRVYFTQGDNAAKDNFIAKMNSSGTTAPVVMSYEITLRKSVKDSPDALTLSFNDPEKNFALLSASYPGEPDDQGTPPTPADKRDSYTDGRNTVQISLDYLKLYSEMGAGFVFTGDFVLNPLVKINAAQLTLGIDGGQLGNTMLTSNYGITSDEWLGNGVGGKNESNGTISLLPLSQDSCGGSPAVVYQPSDRNQVLLKRDVNYPAQCGTIEMRANPLFPADAISVNVDTAGMLVASVAQDDGSANCFESCSLDANGVVAESSCSPGFDAFTRNGSNVLRYDPEKFAQCSGFKVFANEIKPAEITVNLSRAGDNSLTIPIKLSVSNNEAFSAPSLFIGPIFAGVEGGESASLMYPQLWAVTNLKQVGSRDIEFYLADASNPNQPVYRFTSAIHFDEPGTKTFVLNPNPAKLILVGRESGQVIYVQGDPGKSKVSGLTEYASEFTGKFDLKGPLANAKPLISANTGFDPDLVKRILAKALQRAKQSALWRSNGSAWCSDTPACRNNNYQPFDKCCRATQEDWDNFSLHYETTTELCQLDDEANTTAKFCNNLGNPQESGNWDANAQSCVTPINFDTQSAPFCDNNFNPTVQEYCDSRCAPRLVNAGGGENPIMETKMALKVAYGESYKETYGGESVVCSADAAVHQKSISASALNACRAKGEMCPVFSKEKNNVDTPICVPSTAVDGRGLISYDEESNGPDWQYANLDNEVWSCPADYVFAVGDSCTQLDCRTYCSTDGVQGVAQRCDESGYCAPDGTRSVQKIVSDDSNVGPLVEVPFYTFKDPKADTPLSFFPNAYQRGFTYSLPVNTLVQPNADKQDLPDAFASIGIPLPNACNTGNFSYRALYDLQSKLLKDLQGFYWSNSLVPYAISSASYQNVPCATPVGGGATQSCHLLYFDKRGKNDACIKSITQFDYYDSPTPFDSNGNIAGVPLSVMTFAGRLGNYNGVKQFAITPSGYVVAMRLGTSTNQYLDWWKPDGSYGGLIHLEWHCTFWCQLWKFVWSVVKIAVVVFLIYVAINPGAIGPFLGKLGIKAYAAGITKASAPFYTAVMNVAVKRVIIATALLAAHSLYGQGLSIYSPNFNTNGCKSPGPESGWPEAAAQARIYGCKGDSWKLVSTEQPA